MSTARRCGSAADAGASNRRLRVARSRRGRGAARDGAGPANAVYIGDDERDVQAGKSAGVLTIAVTYGYHIAEDPPSSWGADVLIDHCSELLDWLP